MEQREIVRTENEDRKRKTKNQTHKYLINKDRTRFTVDLSEDDESLSLVFDLLEKVNAKTLGREVTFRDLAIPGLRRLTNEDIEHIKDASLNEMEKVQRALDEYNKTNASQLSLGEFLVRQLNIN